MNPDNKSTEEQGDLVVRSNSRTPSSSQIHPEADMKRVARQLIERYYYQLTDGCGRDDCENSMCASCPRFVHANISNNRAAVQALELFKNKAQLCEVCPSKVARSSDGSANAAPSTSGIAPVSIVAAAAATPHLPTSSQSTSSSSSSRQTPNASVTPESQLSQPTVIPTRTSSLLKPEMSSSVTATAGALPPLPPPAQGSAPVVSRDDGEQLYSRVTPACSTPSRSRNATVTPTIPATAPVAVPFITEQQIHEIIETCDAAKSWAQMRRILGQVFNNAQSLILSFRKTAAREHPDEPMDAEDADTAEAATASVDLASVRRAFKELFSISDLPFLSALTNAIVYLARDVEIDLRFKAAYERDPDYINVFLIVLEIPELSSTEFLEAALPQMCKAMGHLPVQAQARLARIWAGFPIARLRDLLDTLQQLITVKIVATEWTRAYCVNDDDAITGAAKVLKMLFYASILAGQRDRAIEADEEDDDLNLDAAAAGAVGGDRKEKTPPKEDPLAKALGVRPIDCRLPAIPWTDFINDSLSDTVEMDRDYTYYKADSETKFTFMHHSFLLTPAVKALGLYFDNRIRMMNERRTSLFQSLVHGAPTTPYLRLRIRRDHIIDDALVALEMAAMDNPADLKKQLYVEFEGEQGIDEGGVSKEFFQLVVDEIFNPDIGMFTYVEETRQFWFNPTSFENDGQFTLIGIVLGLAIYNNVILDIHFPMVVYRKLMGKRGTFDDLADSHPTLHQSLSLLLAHEDDDVEETFMQTFEISYTDVFGGTLTQELKEGGANIPVTKRNRKEYVDLYADYLLNRAIEKQFRAFSRGFHMVTDESPVRMLFRPDEVELLICGSKEFDFFDLEKSTEYDGGFTSESLTIRHFWSVSHSLSEDQKRQLLSFTTGSDRVPVGGLSKLKLIIARNGPNSDRLPTSHTCFNVLLLPDYEDEAKLRERLLKAITYAKGFGML